jgi:SAM-dependent methyltransferase
MSHPHNPTTHEEFDAGYWENRYQGGEGTGRHAPSPSLPTVTADLPPGRALDAGCGRGNDALWLAWKGWRVTAVDVAATALAGAADNARGTALQERIDWVQADLASWEPDGGFDLVTSHYVHVPGPQEDLFRRLANWVAPGGTLLVVGHAHTHGGDGGTHAHPLAAQISPAQITALLPSDHWEVLVAENRTHHMQRPDGTGTNTLHDTVVRARRHDVALGD